LPPSERSSRIAEPGHGFNLHAGTTASTTDTLARKRLTRYIVRPPIAHERLAIEPGGQVRLQLKRPYDDGTTHLALDPLDFISRLVALVPPPRMHTLRFHGVYAPNHKLRKAVVPKTVTDHPTTRKAGVHKRKSWAKLMTTTLGIDVLACPSCRKPMVVLACVLGGPEVRRTLEHLGLPTAAPRLHPARAPPDMYAA
jgi:hypothetical protein